MRVCDPIHCDGKIISTFFKILPGTRWPLHSGLLCFADLAHAIAAPLSMTPSVSLSRALHQRLRLGFDTLGKLFTPRVAASSRVVYRMSR